MYFPTNVYAQPNPAQTVQPVASRDSQNKLLILNVCLSIPVAMPSKAYICGRSIVEIGGSNPAEGMDVRFWYLLCAPCVAEFATSWSFVQGIPTCRVCD